MTDWIVILLFALSVGLNAFLFGIVGRLFWSFMMFLKT